MTTIYFVRHAEAQGNTEKRFNGITDSPLTEKGVKQLEPLAERFKEIHLDAVYASPLSRTMQTAEAVNRYHGLEIIPEKGFIEIDGGSWEARTMDEVAKEDPELAMLWGRDPVSFKAPGGESVKEVFDRTSEALLKVIRENSGKDIAIVSHGCALRCMMCFLATGDLSQMNMPEWSENTAVTKVTADDSGKAEFIFKNDGSHLTGELVSRNIYKIVNGVNEK